MKAQDMIDFAKQNNCENLISQVFYTDSRRFAFQRVGRGFNLYGHDGNFVMNFSSFSRMCEYIKENEDAKAEERDI